MYDYFYLSSLVLHFMCIDHIDKSIYTRIYTPDTCRYIFRISSRGAGYSAVSHLVILSDEWYEKSFLMVYVLMSQVDIQNTLSLHMLGSWTCSYLWSICNTYTWQDQVQSLCNFLDIHFLLLCNVSRTVQVCTCLKSHKQFNHVKPLKRNS